MISVQATGVLLVCVYCLNGDILWCPFLLCTSTHMCVKKLIFYFNWSWCKILEEALGS